MLLEIWLIIKWRLKLVYYYYRKYGNYYFDMAVDLWESNFIAYILRFFQRSSYWLAEI